MRCSPPASRATRWSRATTGSRRGCSGIAQARGFRPLRADRREGRHAQPGARRAAVVEAAYRDFSPELADITRALLRSALDRRGAARRKARRRLLRLDAPEPAPVRAAQLHREPARRDDARARARPRRASDAGGAAGALRAGHAADDRRDGERVRRDAGVPAPDARGMRSRGPARAAVRQARGRLRHRLPAGGDDPLRGDAARGPPRRRASSRSRA